MHAFAVDPQRGLYILLFLLVVIGGSLLLFAVRAHTIQRTSRSAMISRESGLLLNNVFLVVLMLSVLLGTVYPLLIDGLGLGKLSVGAPYFNAVFIPLFIPILLLMGVGIHLKWKKDSLGSHGLRLKIVGFLSLFIPLLVFFLSRSPFIFSVFLGLSLAFWVILNTLLLLMIRINQRGFLSLNQSFVGMIVAHCGVAATVLGISISSGYGIQDDVKMAPGNEINVAGYKVQFLSESPLSGPNFHGTQAQFIVRKGNYASVIYPEKRIYDIGRMAMTESAIDVTPFRDVYIALGEPLNANAWSVRVYYKPFIRWIWGGGFFILVGGLLALTDRRYYRSRSSASHVEVEASV